MIFTNIYILIIIFYRLNFIENFTFFLKMLAEARFKFALECLKKCIMMKPKNNIFFSPHLLYHSLLLVYFGSLYDLELTLKQILHIPDNISKYTIEEYYINGGVNNFCYIVSNYLRCD